MVHIRGQAALQVVESDGVHPVRQTRGRLTRDRLLEAGQRLIAKRSIEALAVADFARAAKCSVGAFYLRFRDKDAFFRALIAQYLAEGRDATLALYADFDDDALVHTLVIQTVDRFRRYAGLIRSAIQMRMDDDTVWEPIQQSGRFNAGRFLEWLAARHGRPLVREEEQTVRFAFQMLYGTINNAIINHPGPFDLEDPAFAAQLERAFRLVLKSVGAWPIEARP